MYRQNCSNFISISLSQWRKADIPLDGYTERVFPSLPSVNGNATEGISRSHKQAIISHVLSGTNQNTSFQQHCPLWMYKHCSTVFQTELYTRDTHTHTHTHTNFNGPLQVTVQADKVSRVNHFYIRTWRHGET
jgi:hypothetical protein